MISMEVGKFNAAKEALSYVRSGNVVGLGSGTTSAIFIRLLGRKAERDGLRLTCVPTSNKAERLARKQGLRVIRFDPEIKVDVAIDGADQVDRKLNLIKGYGGAFLREKAIDLKAGRLVIIVDESKLKKELGGRVPLEVAAKDVRRVAAGLAAINIKGIVRKAGNRRIITDNGNAIIDAVVERIDNPAALDAQLMGIDGVIETGLFVGAAWKVVIGTHDGAMVLDRSNSRRRT